MRFLLQHHAGTSAEQEFLDRKTTATPAKVIGSNQAQSPSHDTATAPARQPAKKPATSSAVFLSRSFASSISGSVPDSVSSSDRTVLVKFPVITAVECLVRGALSLADESKNSGHRES